MDCVPVISSVPQGRLMARGSVIEKNVTQSIFKRVLLSVKEMYLTFQIRYIMYERNVLLDIIVLYCSNGVRNLRLNNVTVL